MSNDKAAATYHPSPTVAEGVAPEWIIDQRERGWPDMHPEDFCHKCGARNPSWCASREDWLTATSAWAAETGREGICCPACFQEMYEAATGRKVVMIITPWRGSWEAHEPSDLDDHPSPSPSPSEPWILGAIERAAERVLAEPREVHWPLNP